MATVSGFTAAKTIEMLGKMIVGGTVDGAGHLILQADDGSTIDAGDVIPAPSDLSILPRPETLGPSYYPRGVSYFGTVGAEDGYPAILATIQTTRENNTRAFQLCVGKANARTWVRASDNGDTWGAWTELVPMVIASNAETQAGSLTTKAVSPAGLASVVGVGEGYRLFDVIKFASSGSFLKASYPGLRAINVKVQAGGGSGGGSSSTTSGANSYGTGGGGGGYAETFITDISGLPSSVAVTVGAGGAAPAAGANDGSSGGESSFGTYAVAKGGAGGYAKASSTLGGYVTGGVGGDATVGDYRISGGGGGGGWGGATLAQGGTGGSSHLGNGGRTVGTGAGGGSNSGDPGGNYGGGGGGAATNASGSARAGGAGAQGIVFVELYR